MSCKVIFIEHCREVATTSRASKVTSMTGTISKMETDRTEEVSLIFKELLYDIIKPVNSAILFI